MRTLFAASTLALFTTTALHLTACSSLDSTSSSEDSASTSTTSEALARQGIAPPIVKGINPGDAGPRPPTPDAGPHHFGLGTLAPNAGVLAPEGVCHPDERIDLRRASRTCEDLPGATVENGVTFVPGAGGRFRVGRLLTGTNAPATLQNKACIYTWENAGSCAAPDTAKLLVASNEHLAPRPATCLTNPASCAIRNVSPATHPPRMIPNSPGRCEVCGLASNRSMWVVLPPDWRGFQYQLAGENVAHYVFLDEAPTQSTDDAVVVDVAPPVDVPEQDVFIIPAYD